MGGYENLFSITNVTNSYQFSMKTLPTVLASKKKSPWRIYPPYPLVYF